MQFLRVSFSHHTRLVNFFSFFNFFRSLDCITTLSSRLRMQSVDSVLENIDHIVAAYVQMILKSFTKQVFYFVFLSLCLLFYCIDLYIK